ncbi:hypothetical protein HFO17_33395 [Rhizobium laguerreae]|uniref:hypothetical protein n=1 Tax=Rhizobium laguerreae TaxID=1076926 RepID=UPI001C910227|nr:hypothetical protein [Rhizobium laguerreae]MBY3239346.1 hypothetical protein [Rhizobium laguerreae]
MQHFPYVGSGPYCYANAFAMMFGKGAPSIAVIEFATSSPFGMQLLGGVLPFFDPFGWTPEAGFDPALDAMGWTSTLTSGGSADQAIDRLRSSLVNGPVWVGPVEMGWLRHQPGKEGPIGADHYVVVLGVENDRAQLHDPQGYPFATLPMGDFLTAWRAETIDYATPFTMRSDFRQVRSIEENDAIRACLPAAEKWLSMQGAQHLPEGTLGNGEAAERLATMIEAECDEDLRAHLIHFAIRVGARRLADAATCLSRIGRTDAAAIAWEQAKLVGALQFPLVVGDDAEAAALLRQLAPTYQCLLSALQS